ncbi:MAG TPA: TetR/AcrR family transcriptional regulator [Candidatus Methylomirabilis sp.]|nr:TetR/AcrR family transcriptional regulator [Candidatus Methylomirabilis sp.]
MPRNLSAAEVGAFRSRLCAVAQERFARDGVDGVSMRQLAEALGCSPMTPYRYFRNKDEILAAVRAAAFDRFAGALEAAAAKAKRNLRAAGQATSAAYMRFALGDPDAYRLIFDLSQPHPDRYPELARASARARRAMSAALEKLVRAGIFAGDPEVLGYVFWATLHGLVVLRLAGKLPAKPTFRTIQREALRLLVKGARAGAKATRRIGRHGSLRRAKRPAGSS